MTDAVVAVLASKWRYHGILVIMLCLHILVMAFNNTVMVFYHDVPSHHCKVPEGQSLNDTLPPNEDKSSDQRLSSCYMYIDSLNHSAGVKKCTEYQYKTEGDEWTAAAEWDLVCDLSYLPSLITSLYFCGMLVGALVLGDLADRFGRRPVIIIAMYLQTCLGLGIYFIQSLLGYIILRTLLGAVTDGLFATSLTLLMEISPIHLRSRTGALYSMFWGIGSVIVGIIAYFLHNWRHMQLAITIPFICSCIYLLLIPESLRWLLSKDKVEAAKSTVRTYAKRNGVELNPQIDKELEELAKEIRQLTNNQTQYSYKHLLSTPEIRKRTIILSIIICSMCLVYYGILFNVTSLGGDKYENFLISGSLEVAAYIVTIAVVSHFNRKPLLFFTVSFVVVTCVTGMVMERFTSDDTLSLASSILILLSKSGIVSAFAVLSTFVPELYPTVVRNMGFSFVLFFARVGSLLAPQILRLEKYTDKIAPFIVFAVLCFASGVLFVLLPETRNKPILETIQEVEGLTKKKGCEEVSSKSKSFAQSTSTIISTVY